MCITCIALINALDYSTHIGSIQRPQTEDNKMFNVMIVRKDNGVVSSEWLTDADGYAVEFKSNNQASKQIALMKQSDATIIDFVIE